MCNKTKNEGNTAWENKYVRKTTEEILEGLELYNSAALAYIYIQSLKASK